MGIQVLTILAKKASINAYAPYSGFKVGAAVRTEKGIFTGCNVENTSYGLTVCAERNAVATAISAGSRHIIEIAVYSKGKPVSPCGACLQVLMEFADKETDLFMCSDKSVKKAKLTDLLPSPFVMEK